MAACYHCGKNIWGGVEFDGIPFCNNDCRDSALLAVADQLPEADVDAFIDNAHSGKCPRCGGPGPIEVHSTHHIWSAIFVTNWSEQTHICCRRCALGVQSRALAFALLFGWWGFPWGFVMTPRQISRNIDGIRRKPVPGRPSWEFQKLMKLNLAATVIAQEEHKLATAVDKLEQSLFSKG